MIGAASLLALAALGADGQAADKGMAFDCALRPWDTSDPSQLKPQPGTAAREVHVWFGRFRPFGKDPVPLLIDPSHLVAEPGQSYHAVDKWPERFSIVSDTPLGRRTLDVNGNRPVADRPGHFQALAMTFQPESSAKGKLSNVLVGDCTVTSNMTFDEFRAGRAAH